MNELTISLDPHRKTPLYEQIYGFIREEIRGGRIRAGERLPSARALSGYLSVSRSTVDLAYEQLVSEGYLESVPCKGYFVCEIEGLYRLDEKKEETKEDDAAEQTPFRYDFAVTGTAPGGFPQNSWKKISKEVLLDADDSLFQLGDAKGEHGLREAIRDYLHHARGVNCRTEQIIVGAGNDYLLIRLLKEFGREYTVSGENAGVHVLVHLPRGLSEAEAVQRAKEDGVRVYGLERYCIGAAADPAQGGTVLLGYAGLSEEEIAEAAAILKKCWNA